jgi:signal recognition particle GTPase
LVIHNIFVRKEKGIRKKKGKRKKTCEKRREEKKRTEKKKKSWRAEGKKSTRNGRHEFFKIVHFNFLETSSEQDLASASNEIFTKLTSARCCHHLSQLRPPCYAQ